MNTSPDQSPQAEPKDGLTKREFLGTLGRFAKHAAVVTLVAKVAPWLDLITEKPENPQQKQPEKLVSTKPAKEVENFLGKDLLNKLLNLPPNGPDRLRLEYAYIAQVKTLDEIDRGFWTLSSKELRAQLLQKRLKIREEKVTGNEWQEKREWAKKQGINPEVLGICLDAYPKALEIVTKLRDKLRPDLKGYNIIVEDLLLTPGGMARLVCYETGYQMPDNLSYGFANIGDKPALQEINSSPDAFPKDPAALKILAQNLSRDTGLQFNADTIPGSSRGNPQINVSGGAIGLQFMPNNALFLYNTLSEANFKFNPFDPMSSVIGAWVFLASRQEYPNKIIRQGYRRGDELQMRGALDKWNQLPDQINKIMTTANDYYGKFIGNKKYKY